jgi:hypothetical protein
MRSFILLACIALIFVAPAIGWLSLSLWILMIAIEMACIEIKNKIYREKEAAQWIRDNAR